MNLQHYVFASAVLFICGQSTMIDNSPNDPYWPLFAQRLSKTTGKNVTYINGLGLTDPTIKKVWTEYRRHMPTLVQVTTPKPTTALPPKPDIYQSAYRFSSSQTQRQTQKLQQQQRLKQANAVVDQILALVKPTQTTTTPKPVSSNNVGLSNTDLLMVYAKLKDLNSRSAGASQHRQNNMMSKLSSMYGNYGPAQQGYQVPPVITTTAPAPTPSSASLGQLIQMYQQIEAAKSAKTAKSTKQPTTTATTSKQEAFDQQLKQFFPQFNNIALPSAAAASPEPPTKASVVSAVVTSNVTGSSTSNATVKAAASNVTKTEQMIFDALLFGPNPSPIVTSNKTKTVTTSTPVVLAPAASPNAKLPSVFSIFGNAAKKSGPADLLLNKTSAILGSYMENVIRTRASRELGCRFMTELIGVEMQHDLPIGMDCTGKCMFPRIKAIKNGPFCVCCPIYVTDNSVTFLSVLKRFKYMTEAPFRVLS